MSSDSKDNVVAAEWPSGKAVGQVSEAEPEPELWPS